MKEKMKSILTKIKNNKKKVVGITLGVFLTFIFTFTIYNINNPTKLNKLFASIGSVPNEAFEDSDFYNCIIDEYNNENSTSKAYTDNLTDEELASITNLTCNWKNIESAKGIEKLTGLTNLDLSGNLVKEIDLSNNTSLTNLNLYYNQLTSIDLSNNTLLEELNVRDNKLTTIDLSNNTLLTNLNLENNQLTSIDLSNNISLIDLNLSSNQLTNIDLDNNTNISNLILSSVSEYFDILDNNTNIKSLTLKNSSIGTLELGKFKKLKNFELDNSMVTNLYLNDNKIMDRFRVEGGYYNKSTIYNLNISNTLLEEVEVSRVNLNTVSLNANYNIKTLDLSDNQLTSIDLKDCHTLEELDLPNNRLTTVDISKNPLIDDLDLSDNQLTSIDLSNLNSLGHIQVDLEGNPLIFDLLLSSNEPLIINEKIKLPDGDKFNYSIADESIATLKGNTITPLKNGATTIRMDFINSEGEVYGSYNSRGYTRKLIVGKLELSSDSDDVYINKNEKYIYVKALDLIKSNRLVDRDGGRDAAITSNFGKLKIDGSLVKVLSNDTLVDEYKLVYFESGYVTDEHVIISSSTNANNYDINAVNCEYEFINDNNEIIISYNGKELERKKVIYMFFPSKYAFDMSNYYFLVFDSEKLNKSDFKTIKNINEIDKEKINVLNYEIDYHDGNILLYNDEDEEEIEPFYVSSKKYDLSKKYIYLGNKEFFSDISVIKSYYGTEVETYISNDILTLTLDELKAYEWPLIKVTSDIYDMSGDKIDLKGEDIDLSKINVTNALLKVDNDKLLVMYNDEVVKEFKLENVKKPTATTKPSSEEKTTTTVKVTTKEEKKTTNKTTTKETTTKKKESIIDKIFGKSETTTKKEETTTTKKTNILKRTNKTTKIESNSGSVTNDSKNSTNKIVTKSNILILLLSIINISLIIYIVINKKNDKEA